MIEKDTLRVDKGAIGKRHTVSFWALGQGPKKGLPELVQIFILKGIWSSVNI